MILINDWMFRFLNVIPIDACLMGIKNVNKL